MKKSLLIAAAVAATFSANAQVAQLEDVTPEGYNFDRYENGAIFKVHSGASADGTHACWSPSMGIYNATDAAADGHVTVFTRRGVAADNTPEKIAEDNKGITIRDFGGYLGKCLVINQAFAPLGSAIPAANTIYGDGGAWPTMGTGGTTSMGITFYADPTTLQHGWSGKAVRIRLVFNVMERGCHSHADAGANKSFLNCYAFEDIANWYRPAEDEKNGMAELGYPGSTWAQWENEGTTVASMPENPTIKPGYGLEEIYDNHTTDADAEKRDYLMQLNRFMVLEFDSYSIEEDHALMAVFNFGNRNQTIVIKEIKFFNITNPFDLLDPVPGSEGEYTPNAGSYLGKRVMSWRYYTEDGVKEFAGGSDSVDAIEIEDTNAAPVYYNLQGVQIENPASGLYIVKRGNKVTKELIRK